MYNLACSEPVLEMRVGITQLRLVKRAILDHLRAFGIDATEQEDLQASHAQPEGGEADRDVN